MFCICRFFFLVKICPHAIFFSTRVVDKRISRVTNTFDSFSFKPGFDVFRFICLRPLALPRFYTVFWGAFEWKVGTSFSQSGGVCGGWSFVGGKINILIKTLSMFLDIYFKPHFVHSLIRPLRQYYGRLAFTWLTFARACARRWLLHFTDCRHCIHVFVNYSWHKILYSSKYCICSVLYPTSRPTLRVERTPYTTGRPRLRAPVGMGLIGAWHSLATCLQTTVR